MENLDKELRKIVSKRRELSGHPEYIDDHMVSELSVFIRQREKELLKEFEKEFINKMPWVIKQENKEGYALAVTKFREAKKELSNE